MAQTFFEGDIKTWYRLSKRKHTCKAKARFVMLCLHWRYLKLDLRLISPSRQLKRFEVRPFLASLKGHDRIKASARQPSYSNKNQNKDHAA